MFFLRFCFILLLLGCICLSVTVLSEFRIEYSQHFLRQKEGQWLYDQCKQPDFSAKLGQHSDACLQISSLFHTTPLRKAFDKVIQKFSFTALSTVRNDVPLAIVWLLMISALIVIMVPPYLSFMERRERDRLTLAVLNTSMPKRNEDSGHSIKPPAHLVYPKRRLAQRFLLSKTNINRSGFV